MQNVGLVPEVVSSMNGPHTRKPSASQLALNVLAATALLLGTTSTASAQESPAGPLPPASPYQSPAGPLPGSSTYSPAGPLPQPSSYQSPAGPLPAPSTYQSPAGPLPTDPAVYGPAGPLPTDPAPTDATGPLPTDPAAWGPAGPLPEPAPLEIQLNPAGEMPPPAPERTTDVQTPTPAGDISGPLPSELPLGDYGLCFSYGLTYGFAGWQSVTMPTTIYISIGPGNQYTAQALGHAGVPGAFAYDPESGSITWIGGSFDQWESALHVDAEGKQVIRIKEVSDQGATTTYRCPRQ